MQYHLIFESTNQDSSESNKWTLATDRVMGGLSVGQLVSQEQQLTLSAQVSYANNGGFVQAKWPIERGLNIQQYDGFWVDIHVDSATQVQAVLKSSQLWMPWQSYRIMMNVTPETQRFHLPLNSFQPYRTQTTLKTSAITQFALLLGEEGRNQLHVKGFGIYKD